MFINSSCFLSVNRHSIINSHMLFSVTSSDATALLQYVWNVSGIWELFFHSSQTLTISEAAHLLLFQNLLYTPTEKTWRRKMQWIKHKSLEMCWPAPMLEICTTCCIIWQELNSQRELARCLRQQHLQFKPASLSLHLSFSNLNPLFSFFHSPLTILLPFLTVNPHPPKS